MYKEYFGFKDFPFSIAPNPHFMYMSPRHREALAHLLYGVQSEGGFILLTGEVGTGKTTVCRCLLEQLPENVDTAFVLNPKLTVLELMAAICDDLRIKYPKQANLKLLIDRLNEFLLASIDKDRKTLLIIDEAQNLSADVLEQLRLLTNLETNQRKLLQIILIGQPELLTLLAREELRQLDQRITARFHLVALNKTEVGEYIAHRLGIAHGKGDLFPPSSVRSIYRLSKGIPRLINLICDRALLGTYSQNLLEVNKATIRSASREIFGRKRMRSRNMVMGLCASLVAISVTAISLSLNYLPDADKSRDSVTYSPFPNPEKPAFKPDVQAFSEDSQGYADSATALLELLAIWGTPVELIAQTEPCRSAKEVGLGCLADSGTFQDILDLDRPVTVQINHQFFTITHAEDSWLELIGPHARYSISASELEKVWNRKFILLWRLPPGYINPVTPGDKGAAVDWLTAQMAVINNKEIEKETGNTYSDSLRRQVEEFQEFNGLAPDGKVDAYTWIHINSVQGLGIPFLTSKNS